MRLHICTRGCVHQSVRRLVHSIASWTWNCAIRRTSDKSLTSTWVDLQNASNKLCQTCFEPGMSVRWRYKLSYIYHEWRRKNHIRWTPAELVFEYLTCIPKSLPLFPFFIQRQSLLKDKNPQHESAFRTSVTTDGLTDQITVSHISRVGSLK